MQALATAGASPVADGDVGVPIGDGILDPISSGWKLVQPVLVDAAVLIGAPLVVPAVVRLVFGLSPILVGILALIASLVQLVCSLAMVVAVPALYLMMLNLASGRTISSSVAVKAVIGRIVEVFVNFLVAGLIAVLTLGSFGCYLGPVFFIEDKRMIEINKTCFEYFKADVKRIIVTIVILLVAVQVPTQILGQILMRVLGFISPFFAFNLYMVIVSAATAVMVVLATGVLANLYVRTRAERGEDIGTQLRNAMQNWTPG